MINQVENRNVNHEPDAGVLHAPPPPVKKKKKAQPPKLPPKVEVIAFPPGRFHPTGGATVKELTETPCEEPKVGYGTTGFKDPAVRKLESDIAFMTRLLDGDFDRLEAAFTGWAPADGILSMQDILWAADSTDCAQSGLRDVARLIKNDPRLFNIINADGNIGITRTEIQACRKLLEDELRVKTAGLSAGPAPQVSGTTPAAAGSTAQPIVPSVLPGLDGAIENLGSTINSVQQQMSELTNQLTGDAKADAKIQGQITQLNTKLQMLLNLQASLLTMMSNVAKLWSETSMNAVRNMK